MARIDKTAPDGGSAAPPGGGETPVEQPDGAPETAGYGARFLALLIDWLLCLMLARLVAGSSVVGLWVYPFLLAEYAFFVGLYTQTPGMWLAKVRCVATADLGPIGMPRAFLRTVLMCLVIPVIPMDRYGRGLHDRAARSVMLSAPRPPRDGRRPRA